MKTIVQKIFFGKGIYLLIGEFLLITILTIKHYAFNELNVDDGKPFFNLVLISICITGGVICIKRMIEWGGYRSKVGKVLLFNALGLFTWATGSIIWIYYNVFLGIAVPFPGWPDLAYIFVNPFFIIGFGLLGYIVALRNQQNQVQQKLYFFFVPVCMALVTFYFIYTLGRGVGGGVENTLGMLLNFYYTGGDIVSLVILMLVSGTAFNYLGERLRLPFTLLVSSIMASYIADTLFAYTTSVGTYVNGGITDFFYALLLFIWAIGTYTLHPRLLEDKE